MPNEDWYRDPAGLFDVKGKVALVTSASGSFGQVAAKTLAGAGAKLMLTAGNKDALDEIAGICREVNDTVETLNMRGSTDADCQKIVEETVKKYGRLDILVVAGGINEVTKAIDMDPNRFMEIQDINSNQSWLMARAAGQQMIKQGEGGKVVLMSSARGLLGHPAGYSAYCTSKSAVDGMTKALGCEWGEHKITVNAIAPTVFRSPLTAWMFGDDERGTTVRTGFLQRVPLGRLGEPEDLAGPLLFLCSKASDFYTGHILYADGGYTAG